MESIEIKSTKEFMNKLLLSDSFDSFYLADASVTTFCTFSVNGSVHKDFFSDTDDINDLSEYISYKVIRPHLLNIIKGKHTPLSFKITLLPPDSFYNPDDLNADLKYVMNIKFEAGKISVISAISRSTFSLDKDADIFWDKACAKFIESIINS